MISGSNLRKRSVAGAIGLGYSVVYGFWTLLATGGGHGNFVWFMLVLFPGVFGLYYPLMAALAIDLRRFTTKIVFGSLLGFNVTTSALMIGGWINGSDFEKTARSVGYGGIIFSAVLHFVPAIVFFVLLLRATTRGPALEEDDSLTEIRLS